MIVCTVVTIIIYSYHNDIPQDQPISAHKLEVESTSNLTACALSRYDQLNIRSYWTVGCYGVHVQNMTLLGNQNMLGGM
jgi:hypothetical protein